MPLQMHASCVRPCLTWFYVIISLCDWRVACSPTKRIQHKNRKLALIERANERTNAQKKKREINCNTNRFYRMENSNLLFLDFPVRSIHVKNQWLQPFIMAHHHHQRCIARPSLAATPRHTFWFVWIAFEHQRREQQQQPRSDLWRQSINKTCFTFFHASLEKCVDMQYATNKLQIDSSFK